MYYWIWNNWNNIDIPKEKKDGETESDFSKRRDEQLRRAETLLFLIT